jgi:hypothetical protein
LTAYEISDMRAQIDTFMLGVVRLLLTAMFASFAVAYALGGSLDAMSISVLLAFYGIILVIVLQALNAAFSRVSALIEDAATLPQDQLPQIVAKRIMDIPVLAKAGILATVAMSFPALCVYLYLFSS